MHLSHRILGERCLMDQYRRLFEHLLAGRIPFLSPNEIPLTLLEFEATGRAIIDRNKHFLLPSP